MNTQQSIFNLAPNHSQLIMPTSIQSNNSLVNVAIRFWGVQGVPTAQRTVIINGIKHNLYVGTFLGTELVETITIEGKEVQRYAPLQGFLQSNDNLPSELFTYLNDIVPIPPGTNISFLLSESDLETLKEFSTSSNSYSNGYQGKTKNAWVIKVPMNLYQRITLLSLTNRNPDGSPSSDYRIAPSLISTQPITLQPGVNLMGSSQFEGEYPFSCLTEDELSHPLVSYFLELLTASSSYATQKSIENGSRAYSPARRNENLPSLTSSTSVERTITPSFPTDFLSESDDLDTSTSTKPPSRSLILQ